MHPLSTAAQSAPATSVSMTIAESTAAASSVVEVASMHLRVYGLLAAQAAS